MEDSEVMFEVLISTCNKGLESAIEVLLPYDPRVRYILVHQLFDKDLSENNFIEADKVLKKRKDIVLIRSKTKGLSKSRNIAIAQSSAPYLIFADDDIQYLPNVFDLILDAFKKLPDAGVITFRFQNKNGEHGKKYPDDVSVRTIRNLFSVSSVEVALRRDIVVKTNTRFDERFGLGAEFPVSEENIFLTDLYKKGTRIFFYPQDLLVHPDITSGNTWGGKHLIARGALFRRVFGLKGMPLLLVFLCKHGKKISKESGFFAGLIIAMHSFLSFRGN